MSIYHSKVDANQPEIVKELRRLGGEVEHVHALKNHCDIDLYFRGVTVKVEIKMPGKPLTNGEDKFKEKVLSQGCKYAVLRSVEEAAALMSSIREHTPNWEKPTET